MKRRKHRATTSNAAINVLVGLHVKSIRIGTGMGLNELARASGVSSGHLSSLENGKNCPTIEVLARLAVALGTSVRNLVPDLTEKLVRP